MRLKRWALIVAGLAGMAGCQNSCNNPAGPSNSGGGGPAPTATPSPLLHDTYEGNNTGAFSNAHALSATVAAESGAGGVGSYNVVIQSPGLNATTGDHFRADFGTNSDGITASSTLTTSFYFQYGSLATSGPLIIHLQVANGGSDAVMWVLMISGNGQQFLFNGSPITGCAYCPAPGDAAWHRVSIQSTGTSATIAFDGYPAESGAVAAYPGGITPDPTSTDLLHLTMGSSLNSSGAKFRMDELKITTP